MQQTIFITGCNGLIAAEFISLIAKTTNWKIIATARSTPRWNMPKNVTFELADITNTSLMNYLIGLYQPTVVINTAAISKPDDCESDTENCWRTNTKAPQELSTICSTYGAFFVQFSSDFVFDGKASFYSEESTPQPLSAYARSKAETDEYIQTNSQDYAIVRTSLVYGIPLAKGRSNLLTWVISSLKENKPIKVVCDQYRTPTLARDIAVGLQSICEKQETGIFNLSGSDYMSVYEIAVKTALFFKLDTNLISEVATITLNEPAQRPQRTFLKIDKARASLNYDPHTFDEGLQIISEAIR